MSKPKQTNTTTTTYGFLTPPKTDANRALENFKFESDPSFGAAFSNIKNKRRERGNSLTGAYVTPEMRQQEEYAADSEVTQQEAQARRALSFDNNQQRYGQLKDVAQLDAPQLVKTGGTETESTSGGFMRELAGHAIGIGSSFL